MWISLASGISADDEVFDIKVYPNPTKGLINMDLPPTQENFNLNVYGANGQLELSRSDLRTGPILLEWEGDPGLYLLQVYTGSSIVKQVKIVIE